MITDNDIKQLAERVLTADSESESSKVLYLRGFVEATQAELGAAPRRRAGKSGKLGPESQKIQLTAVRTVNERFYGVVMDAARGKFRGKELNARTNWARAQVRDIRGYIRSGNDLTAVPPSKLTLKALRVKSMPRQLSAAALRRRVVDKGKALVASALELIDNDKDAARAELELLMAQLATQLLGLGGKPMRNADEAATQHKPFKLRSTVFIPTETAVIRQQSVPS